MGKRAFFHLALYSNAAWKVRRKFSPENGLVDQAQYFLFEVKYFYKIKKTEVSPTASGLLASFFMLVLF